VSEAAAALSAVAAFLLEQQGPGWRAAGRLAGEARRRLRAAARWLAESEPILSEEESPGSRRRVRTVR
jgi:hypothetical protein